MKRIFSGFLALLLAGATEAATLSPIQLLNPAGSAAGQAIISTGVSTAPAWGAVAAGALAPISANTVLGNFTASSAAPAAFAAPSCSTANSALKYTSSTGLSCGTTFALTSGNLSQFASTTSTQLAGVLSDETGSGVAVFGTSPSLTTPTIAGAALSGTFSGTPTFSGAVAFTSAITPSQTAGIVGTTTNNNANAGSVGEYVSNSTTGTSLSSFVTANATSVSLTAGDWDVEGVVVFVPNAATTTTLTIVGVSTVSATRGAFGSEQILTINQTAGQSNTLTSPSVRISLASTTTVYLVTAAQFAVSTMTANGFIRARRVR